MNATPCTHPKKFFALVDGCRTREATQSEIYGWTVGQTHPLFSLAAPNFLCFDRNVRVGAVTVAHETACFCPTNQPHMD